MNDSVNAIHTCLVPQTPTVKMGLIGIGGAGGRLVNTMMELAKQYGMEEFYPCIAINSNKKELDALNCVPTDSKVILKSENGDEIGGCGHDPQTGVDIFIQENNWQETWEKLSNRVNSADVIIVFSGLGGGTGTGIQQEILQWQGNLGIPMAAVCTLPERDNIQELRNAYSYLGQLAVMAKQGTIGTILLMDNQKMITHWGNDYKRNGNLYIAACLHDLNMLSNQTSIDNTTNYDHKEYVKMLAASGFGYINKIEIESKGDEKLSSISLLEKCLENYEGYLCEQDVATANQISLLSIQGEPTKDIVFTSLKDTLAKAKEKSSIIEEQYVHCVVHPESTKTNIYLFLNGMNVPKVLQEMNDILREHEEKINNIEKQKLNLQVGLDITEKSALPEILKQNKKAPTLPQRPGNKKADTPVAQQKKGLSATDLASLL